ncbi:MAG TPA: PDZ domain-containing protein [Terriglobales bacterium]|nr:PDZ domain-containing protein [Terriglobales bacterium]
MSKRSRVLFLALFAVTTVLSALAAVPPEPWPEARSGAYLGVQITAVTPQRASALKLAEPAGALITYVDQDGPACRAGLMENDVVVGFDGSKVNDPQQLQGLIHATPPQKTVTLTIMRYGQRKDVKVTLGSWNVMSRTVSAIALGAPPPPRAYLPELEIPSFTVLSARHGLVVESLSPQLADFFGVPRGHGVLVRSVEGGSPAAAAGIKAGDIILKVNNEVVHDMTDWQRGMQAQSPRIPVDIWRNKHEQTMFIKVPGAGGASWLRPGDWGGFNDEVQALGSEMERMQPEIERSRQVLIAQLEPNQKELKQMQRELQRERKLQQRDIEKMDRQLARSLAPMQKEMQQLPKKVQQAMPSQKDLAAMQRQIRESMPSQQQFDQMRQQIESSMKELTPQLQQEMEQLRKQMEKQKLELQQEFNQQSEI